MPTQRPQVPSIAVNQAITATVLKLDERLKRYGHGTYASRHEALGIVAEEWHELVEAVKGNDVSEFEQELIDVAVGCIFALACSRHGSLQW